MRGKGCRIEDVGRLSGVSVIPPTKPLRRSCRALPAVVVRQRTERAFVRPYCTAFNPHWQAARCLSRPASCMMRTVVKHLLAARRITVTTSSINNPSFNTSAVRAGGIFVTRIKFHRTVVGNPIPWQRSFNNAAGSVSRSMKLAEERQQSAIRQGMTVKQGPSEKAVAALKAT